ncbi:hypothetical protein BDR26DRAFT_866747 [Obelidium mucronatum]|nr:hypothetical protein BDR26DRAFT_866747 [Obelidium mucronatum]
MLNWRDVKGYCFSCEKTGKLQLPKDDKQSAYLIQPYLILQIFVGVAQHVAIELCVSDLNQSKRRFFISTAAKETKNTALHVTLPLGFLKRGVWLNLCFDLLSLVGDTFKGQTFRCLDSIALSGTFRLRKVFTMKLPPPDTTDDYDVYDKNITSTLGLDCIPKTLQYGIGIDHVTQVINLHRIKVAEKLEMRKSLQEIDEFQSWPTAAAAATGTSLKHNSNSNEHCPKLAFGTRPNSEVIPVNPKKVVMRKRVIKTAKSKDENGRVVSKSASRTSIRTHHSEMETFEEPRKDQPHVLTPIIEVRNTPLALESTAETYDPNKYSSMAPLEEDTPSENPLISSSETIHEIECNEEEEEDRKYKLMQQQQQQPNIEDDPLDSSLENDIDMFFKAQEEQNAMDEHQIAQQDYLSQQECPNDIPGLDDNYISHGSLNIEKTISALDQMIRDEEAQIKKKDNPDPNILTNTIPLSPQVNDSANGFADFRKMEPPKQPKSTRHSTTSSRGSLVDRILSKSRAGSSRAGSSQKGFSDRISETCFTKIEESFSNSSNLQDQPPLVSNIYTPTIDELLEKHFKLSDQLKLKHTQSLRASTDASKKSKLKNSLPVDKRPKSLGCSIDTKAAAISKFSTVPELKSDSVLQNVPHSEPNQNPNTAKESIMEANTNESKTPELCLPSSPPISADEDLPPIPVDETILPQLGESRIPSSEFSKAKTDSNTTLQPLPCPTPPSDPPPIHPNTRSQSRYSSAHAKPIPKETNPKRDFDSAAPPQASTIKSKSAPAGTEKAELLGSLNEAVELLQSIKSPTLPETRKSKLLENKPEASSMMAAPTSLIEVQTKVEALAAAAEGVDINLVDEEDDDETLELMFDAETNSYFDPKTGKYYEIEESEDEREDVAI